MPRSSEDEKMEAERAETKNINCRVGYDKRKKNKMKFHEYSSTQKQIYS